jgi:hypothetical protein
LVNLATLQFVVEKGHFIRNVCGKKGMRQETYEVHARKLAAPALSKLLPQLSLWGNKKGKKTGGCAPRQHV